MCLCGLSVGSGFYGLHDVAAGAAGISATGVEDVVDLTAGVAAKCVDVVGVTSLVMQWVHLG